MTRLNDLLAISLTALSLSTQAISQRTGCPGSSGPQYASCCNAQYQSYSKAKEVYESPTPTYVNWIISTVYTTNSANIPLTTLCDGFPRFKSTLKVKSYTTRITPSPTTYQTIYISKTYTKPPPSCTINESDCIPFASAWSSSSSAAETDTNAPYPTATLPCSTYLACPTANVASGGQDCKLYASDVTVYYWPASTASNLDFCATSKPTLPPSNPTSKPKSTVIDGKTFISPFAYIKIGSASAMRHQGRFTATNCGYGRKNVYLTFPNAAALSTRHYKPGTAKNTRTLDLVDLATPAPASVYFFGTKTVCTTSGCPTLTVDFTPTLDVPTALKTVDGEWKYCEPRSEGVFGTEVWVPLETVKPSWPKN